MKKTLHGVRGGMAFVILVHHLAPYAYAAQKLPVELNLHHAVDVFFVLSGYVLSHVYAGALPFRRDSFRRYCVHRVARIVPLAWLSTLLLFAIHKAMALRGLEVKGLLDTSVKNLAGNLLFLDANLPGFQSAGVKWSVSVEMLAYFALFPLSYRLAGGRTRQVVVFLLLICAQALLWEELSGLGRFFSRCAPGFLAGCLLFRFSPEPGGSGWNGLLFLAGVSGCVLCADRFQVLFSTLVVLSAVPDTGRIAKIFGSRPMLFLGDVSYSLFLLHILVVLGVSGVVRFFPASRATYPLWIVLPMGLSLLMAHLSFRHFEKPCGAAIKRWLLPAREGDSNASGPAGG